jgi:hypothetical protein
MRLFFADSDMPELAGLNDSSRRLVLDRAYLLVSTETLDLIHLPPILCFVFGFFGWLGGAYLLCAALSTDDMITLTFGSHGGAFIGGLAGGFIGACFLRSRLRSSVRRIMREESPFV